MCYFNDKPDSERIFKQDLMPIFGVKKADKTTLVIVEGLKYEFSIVVGVKNGAYYIYPRFYLNGKMKRWNKLYYFAYRDRFKLRVFVY